ncbi:hypothetical protein A9Q84_15665 [Halobacteriovorax marinus]|uniref:Serine protease n=1 Tax=Halobacteriovorax marinus TaxID=97084 RepID=A0A1Y5F3X4_9BACT|nr:hypothetical protein A9Q84_15665 [Halobacteriovorax marinus]
MKLALLGVISTFVISVGVSSASSNIDKVVYGDDNRVLTELSKNSEYKSWATATAAMIPKNKLRFPQVDDRHPESVKVFSDTLKVEMNLCDGERFEQSLSPAICSGFLVAKGSEQFLVTAGHCMRSSTDCSSNKWVFGFQDTKTNSKTPYFTTSQVYSCVEIMEQTLDENSKDDYAVIRLDRKVEGVTPLSIRKEGKIDKSDELVVIGHPSGLPSIIDDKGSIRKNDNDFFLVANLDTFAGNSGSVVMNANSGVVEGILVRGEDDYNYVSLDETKSCYEVNSCKEGDCRGEDVTRITNISFLTGRPGPVAPEVTETRNYDDNFISFPWGDPDHGGVFPFNY